jgi:proteasome lid subunit RPN8/RPN11
VRPSLSPEERARYARQLMLPPFADGGQARILSSTAAVAGDSLAHAVACRYARRAGFSGTSAGEVDIDTNAPARIVTVDAARQVLAGSRAALAAIRARVLHWTQGGLTISRAALDAVEADAVRGYAADEEACGYLRGPDSEPLLCDEAVTMTNLANDLHRLDPERYFRTAKQFFAFNEKKFDDAVRASQSEGSPVKVLYHSHLDVGAYFSPTDRAMMSMGEAPVDGTNEMELGAGPNWPLAFLVTSVRASGVDDHRLFVWDGDDFVASAFNVID